MSEPSGDRTNRLRDSRSPYLRQHAENPVDWYPWGDEAFERARSEDRPIFLSVGYSACHWCHVMAHESFEDEVTARLMNENFVNIKVDREERPDIDDVYMTAVQMMTRQGGWPMSVFLTPDGSPFFGGTYFPPQNRQGMPSFRTVLDGVASAYRSRRDEVTTSAGKLVAQIREMGAVESSARELVPELLDRAFEDLRASFDARHGGLGSAPKFPQTMALGVSLRRYRATGDEEALRIVTVSLEKMARGGLHDHLAGGFHRYSTDDRWLVPHFEKMLYDNALMSRLYLEAWQVTGDELFRTTGSAVLDYVRREMTSLEGGFYSAEDADSEAVEGKFYVWRKSEILTVLGDEDGRLFCRVYDVTDEGNFEDRQSIPNLPETIASHAEGLDMSPGDLESTLASCRETLRVHREKRVKPGLDDKILVAWNGWMIASFAFAARVLDSPAYRQVALAAGERLWRDGRDQGRLLHSVGGDCGTGAYLDDVAALGVAFVELYHATFDAVWLDRAVELGELLLDEFEDREHGGFFYTGDRAERLIARSKNPYDNAVPSGNSLAVELLLKLAAFTGEQRYTRAAEATLVAFSPLMERAPRGFAHMLEGLDSFLEGYEQIVIVGGAEDANRDELVAAAFTGYHPSRIVASAEHASVPGALRPLFHDKEPLKKTTAAYLCRQFACAAPTILASELREQSGAGVKR